MTDQTTASSKPCYRRFHITRASQEKNGTGSEYQMHRKLSLSLFQEVIEYPDYEETCEDHSPPPGSRQHCPNSEPYVREHCPNIPATPAA